MSYGINNTYASTAFKGYDSSNNHAKEGTKSTYIRPVLQSTVAAGGAIGLYEGLIRLFKNPKSMFARGGLAAFALASTAVAVWNTNKLLFGKNTNRPAPEKLKVIKIKEADIVASQAGSILNVLETCDNGSSLEQMYKDKR